MPYWRSKNKNERSSPPDAVLRVAGVANGKDIVLLILYVLAGIAAAGVVIWIFELTK